MVSTWMKERIPHQVNLESTAFFFPSLSGQKEMEELIEQPAPVWRKMHFRESNFKNFLGGMPLDTQALWAFRYMAVGHIFKML